MTEQRIDTFDSRPTPDASNLPPARGAVQFPKASHSRLGRAQNIRQFACHHLQAPSP